MPLKLRNADVLPPTEAETITVLGLEIPLTDSLPFGAQVEVFDLQQRLDAGEVGQFEYLVRVFCLFTKRLPKREWVRYDDLARQHLHPEDIAELTEGTLKLLAALRGPDGDEVGEGNAPKRKRGKTS